MNADIVIVGSGVVGATIAQKLLESKKTDDIVMLEAGSKISMHNYRHWLDFITTGKRPYEGRFTENIDRDEDADLGDSNFSIRKGRLLGRGGTTVHWGGWCLRYKPEDFQQYTSSSVGIDWPFTYSTLEPFYHQAELFLGVAGDSSDDCPPRKGKPYPNGPIEYTLKDAYVAETLEQLRYSYSHLPVARNSNCVVTGTCKYCPVGGLYVATMSLDLLEEVYKDKFQLLTLSPVKKVELSAKSKASGVTFYDIQQKKMRTVNANVIIICAGAIESPKILQASTHTSYWPTGVGNKSGHVGQHVVSHPLIFATGWLSKSSDVLEQELDFPTLMSREFDSIKQQRNGKFFFVRDGRENIRKFHEYVRKGKQISEIQKMMFEEIPFELQGLVEAFPAPGNEVSIAKGSGRFALPRTKVRYFESSGTVSAKDHYKTVLENILTNMKCRNIKIGELTPRSDHAVSTCRMSKTESEGVVDKDLKVYGIENVYVCSNGVLPTVGAVNPTLTTVALAIRFAESFRRVESRGQTLRLDKDLQFHE